MTKDEMLLHEKVDKSYCEKNHDKLENYMDEKIKLLEKFFLEKFKMMSSSNTIHLIVHLIGYLSIVLTLVAMFAKMK